MNTTFAPITSSIDQLIHETRNSSKPKKYRIKSKSDNLGFLTKKEEASSEQNDKQEPLISFEDNILHNDEGSAEDYKIFNVNDNQNNDIIPPAEFGRAVSMPDMNEVEIEKFLMKKERMKEKIKSNQMTISWKMWK